MDWHSMLIFIFYSAIDYVTAPRGLSRFPNGSLFVPYFEFVFNTMSASTFCQVIALWYLKWIQSTFDMVYFRNFNERLNKYLLIKKNVLGTLDPRLIMICVSSNRVKGNFICVGTRFLNS